jgi:hypothetical protein
LLAVEAILLDAEALAVAQIALDDTKLAGIEIYNPDWQTQAGSS